MVINFLIYLKDEKTGEDIQSEFVQRNQVDIVEKLQQYLKEFGAILNINLISEFGNIYFDIDMVANETECSLLEKQSPIFKVRDRDITFLPPFLYEEKDDQKIEEIIEFSDFESEFFDLTKTKKIYSLWFTHLFDKPIHFYTNILNCKKNCCHIKVLEKDVNINKIKLTKPFYNHDIIGLELLDNLRDLSFEVSTFYYPSINNLKLDKLTVGYLFTETITYPIKTIIFCDMYMCTNKLVKNFNFISNLYTNYPCKFVNIEKNKTSDIFNRVHITRFVRVLLNEQTYINDDIEFDEFNALEDFIYFIEEESKMNDDKKIEYIMNMLGVMREYTHSKKIEKLIKTYQKKNEERLLNILENEYNKDILGLMSSF